MVFAYNVRYKRGVKRARAIPQNMERRARAVTYAGGEFHYLKNHFARYEVVCHGAKEYVPTKDQTFYVICAQDFFFFDPQAGMKCVC